MICNNGQLWQNDYILNNVLVSMNCDVELIDNIKSPVWIRVGVEPILVGLDYSFFIFLRSLCRSSVNGGHVDGAFTSLLQFQIALKLQDLGRLNEATGLLLGACELRSRYSVYHAVAIREALLYQKCINIVLSHENGHRIFEVDVAKRNAWLEHAREFLLFICAKGQAETMYPNERVRIDIITTASKFLKNTILLEELACDVYSIEKTVGQDVARTPRLIESFIDAYLISSRITMISFYVCRILGEVARLIAEKIDSGLRDLHFPEFPDRSTDLLSNMRLRIQIIILKLIRLKSDIEQIKPEFGNIAISKVLNQRNDEIERLFNSVMSEMTINTVGQNALDVAHIAHRANNSNIHLSYDNEFLIKSYLTEFWFSRINI